MKTFATILISALIVALPTVDCVTMERNAINMAQVDELDVAINIGEKQLAQVELQAMDEGNDQTELLIPPEDDVEVEVPLDDTNLA